MLRKTSRVKPWELALCIALVLSLSIGVLSANAKSNLSDKLIRLHVVSATNNDQDQTLKLQVRDQTLSLLEAPLANITDVVEARQVITENIPMLERDLQNFLQEQGVTQPVSVSLEREPFPTREYSTFSLPAGPYTALRVSLGQAEGQNWWCVVFPPLCAASAMGELSHTSEAAGLTRDEFGLITQADETYVVRFKVAEWIGNIRNRFVGN